MKGGKTAAAWRWVAVPDWLMLDVAATCPREDRTAERPVFLGFTRGRREERHFARVQYGRDRALPPGTTCGTGTPLVKIAEGVPVTTLAAQLLEEVTDARRLLARPS